MYFKMMILDLNYAYILPGAGRIGGWSANGGADGSRVASVVQPYVGSGGLPRGSGDRAGTAGFMHATKTMGE